MDVDRYRALIAPLVAGRPCIVAVGAVVTATPTVRMLQGMGAGRALILADSLGAGELPTSEEAEWLVSQASASDMTDAVRGYNASLEDPAPEVLAAIEAHDPARRAVLVASQHATVARIGGRPRLGARKPGWRRFEDKTRVDGFLDRVGVRRAPSRVVAATPEALGSAHSKLRRGEGTVWSGDSSAGINGGAEYVRWVRTPAEAAEAVAFLSARCRLVRVAPFVEGIPCGIHGIVFGDYVAALRPVEMVVLRPGGRGFRFCGMASWWDPPDEHRAGMRETVGRVGAAMRDELDFRGPFTLDGIMSKTGFVPTEINTRAGALLSLGKSIDGLPLELLLAAVSADAPLDFQPARFERELLGALDANRSGGGLALVDTVWGESEGVSVGRSAAGDLVRVTAGATPVARILRGPSATGGIVLVNPDPAATPRGASVAPLIRDGFQWADGEWSTGLGALDVAMDLHMGPR